jgi:putative flippase GtrA
VFEPLVLLVQRSQPVRYVINGVVATGVHYAFLSLALRGLAIPSAGLANLFAAMFGIAASFVGSRYFVFRVFTEAALNQLTRFALLYGLIACLHASLLFVWTDMMGLNYSAGFLIGVLLQVIASYFGNKYLVFRKRADDHA